MNKDELQNFIKETVKDTVKDEVSNSISELQKSDEGFPKVFTESRTESTPQANNPALKGVGAARFVRALAVGHGDPERAKHFAEKKWDDDMGRHISKALGSNDFDAGGFMVPPEMSSEIIELLRSENVVRRAGARVVPMGNGSITIPRQDTAASASYVGENNAVNASEPGGGQITLSAKKLMGVVPMSNDLIQFAEGDAADMFVRDDLVAVLSTREDKAFLRDDGTADTPKGIRHWAVSSNISSSNGDTLTNIRNDLQDLYNDLKLNNVALRSPAIMMSERERSALQFSVTDADGRLVFADEIANGRLMGWPVFSTTNIPTNLGTGSDSEVYLVDMNDVMIGESQGLSIDVSAEATYQDNSGTQQSAFAKDQTVVRAIMKHDLALRHSVSAAVKTGVTWGS